jgi:hypothetical protein
MSQFRLVAMTRQVNQTVNPPVAPTITFLSNTATDYLQTRNLVDKVTALLAVPPKLGKAIPAILHVIYPATGHQGAPVAGSGYARRQVIAGSGDAGSGKGGDVPSPCKP